jgi:hypothetical protein
MAIPFRGVAQSARVPQDCGMSQLLSSHDLLFSFSMGFASLQP